MKTQTSIQPRHIWVNTRLSTAILILLVNLVAICLTACNPATSQKRLTRQDVAKYAQMFCQTTSDKTWQKTKSYLLSHSSEKVQEELKLWFEGSNYSHTMEVSLHSQTTAIHEGSGTAMLLLESSRSDLHDWVVLTLVYDDYQVVDFGYRAIDEMAMS